MSTEANKLRSVTIATTTAAVILCALGQANATLVYFDTSDPFVHPGETISVRIYTEYMTDYIRMARISNNVAGSVTNLYLNPNYYPPLNVGSPVPVGQVLIVDVSSGIPAISPQVSGVLYSFDYKVPKEVVHGQVINIFPDPSSYNKVYVTNFGLVTPDSLSLIVVPEPGTILFLIIAGLVVTRRSRERRCPTSPITNRNTH